MKKLMLNLFTLISVLIIVFSLALPAFAAENKIVYREDFSGVTTFEQLNWPVITSFTNASCNYSITKDNRLLFEQSNTTDAFFLILDDAFMKEIVKDDYTVEYQITHLGYGSANPDRYLTIALNYDTVLGNSYNCAVVRTRGQGEFQARNFGTWNSIEGAVTDDPIPEFSLRLTNENSLATKLFGVPYDSSVPLLIDKDITVRWEIHTKERYAELFVNDVKVSRTVDSKFDFFEQNSLNYSALGFMVGGFITGTLNEITVATGIGIPAETTTTAPASTTAAPSVTTAAPSGGTAETPATSDSAVIAAVAVMFAAASALIMLKRRAPVK